MDRRQAGDENEVEMALMRDGYAKYYEIEQRDVYYHLTFERLPGTRKQRVSSGGTPGLHTKGQKGNGKTVCHELVDPRKLPTS